MKCPECGEELVREHKRYECLNEECPVIALKGRFKRNRVKGKKGRVFDYELVSAKVLMAAVM